MLFWFTGADDRAMDGRGTDLFKPPEQMVELQTERDEQTFAIFSENIKCCTFGSC